MTETTALPHGLHRAFRALALLGVSGGLLFLTSACGDPDAPRSQEDRIIALHPVADSIVLPPPDRTLALSPSEGTLDAAHPLVQSFLDAPIVVEIGELDGPEEQIFGTIADAMVMDDGSIAILDRQANELRLFDPDGVFLHAHGGSGDGPGEFGIPAYLVSPGAEALWVVDRRGFVHRYRHTSHELSFVDRVRIVPMFPSGACAAGGNVILHDGYAAETPGGSVLQRWDGEGNRLEDFAEIYNHSMPLILTRMRQGILGCDPDGLAVLVLAWLGRAVAYDARDGSLLWQTEFAGLDIPRLIEYEDPPAVNQRFEGEEHIHEPLRTVVIPGGSVLVQWKRTAFEDVVEGRTDEYRIDSWILDANTGAGEYAGQVLPEILRWDDRRIVVLSDGPFPRIVVFAAPGSESQ